MNADEKAEFESQLKQNPHLQQQVNDFRVAIEGVRQAATKEKVSSLHREMMQELKKDKASAKVINMKKVVRYTMAVAASILLVLVGIQTFKYFNETFVEYSVSNERGTAGNTTTIEIDYKNRNYASVIKDAQSNSLSPKDSFLTAVSFLQTGNTSSAIQWLNRINANSPYHQDAEFYLSLAYLKNKDYDKALDLMQQIHDDSNHPYHANISDDVIKKLKKLK
jgi:tetratricopeptide (TPR) repeat protein